MLLTETITAVGCCNSLLHHLFVSRHTHLVHRSLLFCRLHIFKRLLRNELDGVLGVRGLGLLAIRLRLLALRLPPEQDQSKHKTAGCEREGEGKRD